MCAHKQAALEECPASKLEVFEYQPRAHHKDKQMSGCRLVLVGLFSVVWVVLLERCQEVACSQAKSFGSGLQSSEIHQVRGLVGSNKLELPCQVDQSSCGEVYYITWSRQSMPSQNATGPPPQQPWTRVYLYTGANDSAPNKPMGELLNRAHFLMPDKRTVALADDEERSPPMARLVIEEPKLSDEALYKCDVTYVKGKCPSISLVQLQMMVLPARAKILANDSPLSEGQLVGPYNELDQLHLTCLVVGGRPQPSSVIWRKLDASGRTINLLAKKTLQPGQLELELNHTLTSADLGAKFECHVEHEAIEQTASRIVSEAPKSFLLPDSMLDLHPARPAPEPLDSQPANTLDSHVLIDLNVGVQSLDLFMAKLNKRNSSEPLKEGDLVELECVAYNSRPAANITWLNGSESVEQVDAQSAVGIQSGAGWPSEQLRVNQQLKHRHKRLLQRNQVHLNPDGQTYNTHSFLSIKLSRHEHKAQILCQALNGPMRQPMGKSIELEVEHAPIVLMEPAAGIQVNEEPASQAVVAFGEGLDNVILSAAGGGSENTLNEVHIYCIYSANPSQLLANSTRWFKDGQHLTGLASSGRLSESYTPTGYPRLSIRQVNRKDAGLYECQLANSVGSSERLPASEAVKLEVNFRPSVRLKLFRPLAGLPRTLEYSPDQLVELEPSEELVQAGNTLVLGCHVLEARPSKILRYQWTRSELSWPRSFTSGQHPSTSSSSESNQLVLHSLPTNFTATSFTCLAFNSLGASDHSNQIELRLSYSPGRSLVRPIQDATLRKTILASGRPAHTSSVIDSSDSDPQQTLVAGRELLLECVTADLGQPRANLWLWFKSGQPIESPASSQPIGPISSTELMSNDSPMTGQDLSASYVAGSGHIRNRSPAQDGHNRNKQYDLHSEIKLISSGRYLFIPSIQLVHKGNYSCVAVNRLGPGLQPSSSAALERDLYRLHVALAPSFVQPLASRTYWPEVSSHSMDFSGGAEGNSRQLELICQVQCEPLCQIEWLKNNEPLDLKRQSESLSGNYVTYQVKQKLMDENPDINLFKSVESKLVVHFQPIASRQSGSINSWAQLEKDKTLERRHLLSGSNYTCQSSPNSMGPPVRSTTRFIVQFPPENVFINSSSDKLSFVEGSNGPRLQCEASGEPQVQYRWFLVKSSGSNDIGLGSQKRSSGSISQSSDTAAGSGSDYAINQLINKALDSELDNSKGANDPESIEQDLIELTSSASVQVGGTSGSFLDMSNLRIDRRQSGNYICEASNRFGLKKQSVYVNVLFKPTCATLHLHSLDLTMAPSLDGPRKESDKYHYHRIKPHEATDKDEYSPVQDTSEDYIDLRRILILSPLLKYHSGTQEEELSFRGSIFHTILYDKINSPTISSSDSRLKDKDALFDTEEKSDINHNSLVVAGNHLRAQDPDSKNTKSSGDSWGRFNILLLKFLNNYMKKIKNYQEQLINGPSRASVDPLADKRQERSSSDQKQARPDRELDPLRDSTRNLLTFACLAQDGNPMTNLTFDWSFGTVNLPETSDSTTSSGVNNLLDDRDPLQPIMIYANENYTLHITLIRRLDTRFGLNPFQMSLLTLNVMLDSTPTAGESNRVVRNTQDGSGKATNSGLSKAKMAKNGHQFSNHDSLRANPNNNNLQFAHEFSSRPYNLIPPPIELNEHNWQEQIGNLLKCSVTNHIGTSEVCHVRVNLAERLKIQNSSSEFARWRMPSIAHKSLLIISVLLGCCMIIFITFALVLSPYIKAFKANQDNTISGAKEENNTGQSSSSQKSSMLGLLGNGDSSVQGSSDDDSSARVHHLDKSREQNRMLDMSDVSMSRSVANGYHSHQVSRDSGVNYDQPRPMKESRLVYHGAERTPDNVTFDSYHYPNETAISKRTTNRDSSTKTLYGSAGSKLLANLKFKSLSKFKVDRIADLSNFAGANLGLQLRNASNSETNTTDLSASALDSLSSKKVSPNLASSPTSEESPTFFGAPALRRTHSSFRHKQPRIHRLEPSYYLFNQNGLQSNQQKPQLIQSTNSQGSMIMPTYSNMVNISSKNVMDEFIRRREPDTTLQQSLIYRSQSVRPQAMYMLENDINQFYPQQMATGSHQSPAIYRTQLDASRPPVAVRSSHRHMVLADSELQQSYQPVNNRLSVPNYNQLFGANLVPAPAVNYLNTIDGHLNRLADSRVLAPHSIPNRLPTAYPSTLDTSLYEQNTYKELGGSHNQQTEHIYDVNAYATPEQTPLRSSNSIGQAQTSRSERPRVSQLIQTFNSKAPEI